MIVSNYHKKLFFVIKRKIYKTCLFNFHIANKKLQLHRMIKSTATGRISPIRIFCPNIRLRKALIMCVIW